MRAREFVVEYKTEEYNGLRFTTDIKNGQLIVRALDDWGTNELGHVVFNIGDQDELDPQDLEVDDRYQGQGIAKTMYDYVKTLGYEIHRSWDQTPAGAGFWNKHRGEDERVWEDRGQGAAGIILYAEDTGRYGLQQRSDDINDPGQWAAWGGGREPGETLEQCARRELAEEGGYTGPIELHHLASNPKYTTFIGVVPHEFEPRANDEWKDYCWTEAGDWPSPLHPGVAAALKNIKTQYVTEAFDQPYPFTWEKSEYGDYDANAKLPDGSYLNIMFEHTTPYEVSVSFWRNNSQEVTGEGDAQRVFATVLKAIQEFLKIEQPANISFSASKEIDPSMYYGPEDAVPNPESRAKLYNRLVQRYAATWGYDARIFDHGDQVTYELLRQSESPFTENFHDGKVKGKSRPGRVKRAGASCSGSVTNLRAKAKKASGERAKMYHWCANMKSGKKK